jgi:hypothetical protein
VKAAKAGLPGSPTNGQTYGFQRVFAVLSNALRSLITPK